MTAKEFLENERIYPGLPDSSESNKVEYWMIKFAKYHVKQALKEVLNNIPCLGSSTDIVTYEEVENEVLNAYPLNLIK